MKISKRHGAQPPQLSLAVLDPLVLDLGLMLAILRAITYYQHEWQFSRFDIAQGGGRHQYDLGSAGQNCFRGRIPPI